ncbi:uncharacterized protein [Mytilus edulis]|uniref:uncharacterized protein n=1 Tax=Mytilus edulis TaxID=6550 RepID=UPI0039EEE978
MELRKFRKTASTGDLQPSTINTRLYTLNKEKALKKKSDACQRQHLKYELKAGNNFVVEMSAGAYEILKGEIHKILNSTDENSLAVVQKQDGVEEAGLTVDSCYRVYNRKQNGQAGSVLKFSINLYHTSCSMNVNGKRVDIFINDIFDKLCEKIRKEYCEVQLLNNSIHTCISQMKKYSSKVIQKSITNSDNRQGSHQKDNETSLNIYNRNNQNVELQGAESDTSICPSCRKYVEDGIGCDRCDYWYHYECENISKNIGSEELKHIEYICRFCNDDMLYESRNYMECDEEQHNPPEDSSTDLETYQIHNIESIQEIQDQSLENNNTENIKEILIEEKEAIKTLNPDDQNEDQKILPEATEDETLVKRVISPIQPIIKMDTKSQEKKASGQSYENSQNIDKTSMQSTDKKKGSKSSTGTKRSDKDEIIVSQKTRILNLENEIKHMRTVIETIKTQNDQPNQNQTRTDNTTRIDNNQQEWTAHNNMKEMLLEHRLRAIEAQMTQNMCIQTALTTQIALQVKNHPPTNPYMCTGNFPSHPHLMNHGIPQYTHTAYTNQYVPTTNTPMYMPTGIHNQFAMPTEMHNPYTMPTGMQMQGPYTMPTGRQMQSLYTIPTYINQQQTSGVYIPTAPFEVLQRQQGQYQHHNLSNTHINPNIGRQNQRRMNATSHPLNPEPIQQTTKPGLLPHPQNFNKNMNHTGQQNQKNAVRANTIQKQQNINTQRERDRDISIKSKIKTLDKRTHNQGLTGTLNQSQRMDTHNEINIPSQDIEKHQNTLTEHLSCTHPTSDNLKVQTINDTSETDKEQGNFRVLAQESRPPDQEQAAGKVKILIQQ